MRFGNCWLYTTHTSHTLATTHYIGSLEKLLFAMLTKMSNWVAYCIPWEDEEDAVSHLQNSGFTTFSFNDICRVNLARYVRSFEPELRTFLCTVFRCSHWIQHNWRITAFAIVNTTLIASLLQCVSGLVLLCNFQFFRCGFYHISVRNNNNNNNHDDIYSVVIYGSSHMREFTVVPLGQSRWAPGGRQLVGRAENLTFESACRLL